MARRTGSDAARRARATLAALAAGAATGGVWAATAGAADAATLPRPGLPVAGASMLASPARAHTRVFWPGDGWLSLRRAAALPLGIVLDASHGALVLATARDSGGTLQSESLTGAAFSVTQTANVAPITVLTLLGGAGGACTGRPGGGAAVVRRLDATGRGWVQVDAADAIARTDGASWTITDRCDGTEVAVRSGRVAVRAAGARTRIEVVRAGQRALIAGPPPDASAALPVLTPAPAIPTAAAPTTGASTPAPSPAAAAPAPAPVPTRSPQQQLAAIAASVSALTLSGQPGQDLTDDLSAAQTALAFGTSATTCSALAPLGQAIFENVAAPTGAISAVAGRSLLDETGALDVSLGCPVPTAAQLQAGDELLATFGALATLGLNPAGAGGALSSELDQAGEALIVGDETDGCSDLTILSSAISLLELAGPANGGLTPAQGQTLTGPTAGIPAQLDCAASAPAGG